MVKSQESAGYFRSGVPYCRVGHGPQPLVVFQGLQFEHKPPTGFSAWYTRRMYNFLEEEYTVYLVTPKPRPPAGTSMRDMANDYAVMIREEFGGPVDVIGTSTGGSIVQHFAADHPDLVRRLVIHSSAHTSHFENPCEGFCEAPRCHPDRREWTEGSGRAFARMAPKVRR